MKPLRKYLKPIALFLAVTFLMQSCVVYASNIVSLEQAAKSELQVKITKKNGEKRRFARVVLDKNGQFYGKKFVNTVRPSNTFLIDKDNIVAVQPQDKKTSTILNIAVPLVIVGSLIYSITLVGIN